MAPLFPLLPRQLDPGSATAEIKLQWVNPSDIFSLLLLLGGDIVARALAQIVGPRFTPIALSFGTFPYQFSHCLKTCNKTK